MDFTTSFKDQIMGSDCSSNAPMFVAVAPSPTTAPPASMAMSYMGQHAFNNPPSA